MSVGATAELLVFIPWKAKEVQKEPQYVTRDYESARNAIVIYNLHHSQHELKEIGMIKLFCSLQSLVFTDFRNTAVLYALLWNISLTAVGNSIIGWVYQF